MRRLVPLLVLPLAFAPAASACTIDNCVEVATDSASWNGLDLHALDADCVVAGRAGASFTVTAVATAHEAGEPAAQVTVHCFVFRGTTQVYNGFTTLDATAAVHSDEFVSGPDIRVCVTATASWAHGDSVSTDPCW